MGVKYQTTFKLYPYQRSRDQDADLAVKHAVVIVGGGPIGMALALDLGRKGIACVVLDDHDGVGQGSRAICFAKRTLEIADRLGVGSAILDKGVAWNLGRVFRQDKQTFAFNLLAEEGHKCPAFINLQQPYFEKYVVDQIREEQARGAPIEIRGKNRVTGIDVRADHAMLKIDTPEGPYQIRAKWVIAADGANSSIRQMMGLGFEGRVFEDNFLIADIVMQADFPVERRFWFDPPFNPGQTALMHRQPDDVWRLDFQLGRDIDRAEELNQDRIRARVRAMIGPDIEFDLEWTSIYTFRCATMKDYRHGPVIFAGDAAHQVSPFGARGANGGLQDIDNLGWKLALVVTGAAEAGLLDSYQEERKYAALENILNSSRTADFLTPRSPVHALFRDAVLDLAERHKFARPMVNSGRLSLPATYDNSSLNGHNMTELPDRTRPGAPIVDAPTGRGWLSELTGNVFQILAINTDAASVTVNGITAEVLALSTKAAPLLTERYLGAEPSAIYLLRPDQHVAARWGAAGAADIRAALKKAIGG